MLRLLTIVALWALCQAAMAGISFKFSPGSTSGVSSSLKTTMENNITALLTEIDNAGRANRALNFTGISIESGATKRLTYLWKSVHMTCKFTNNVKDCLHDMQGYQARDIYVAMLPQDDTYNQGTTRALTISLNRSGQITGVRLALESQADVSTIMAGGNGEVADKRRREEILKWVEDFRCYYNEKNLEAIRQVFSEDALIITGSVVTPKKNEVKMTLDAQVKYKVQDKKEYMNNLTQCFKNNAVINLKFEYISVVMSGSNPDIYGVKLKQTWRSSTYSDVGWLFLLWDFHDEDHPQIHVRTWQPYNLGNGQVTTEEDVFALGDFIIN